MNVFLFQSAIKSDIAAILKDGIILGFDDACALGRVGQLHIMLADLFAQSETPFYLDAFVGQFLPPRLDGEIGLAMRHDFFAGIGVLDDEIAGVAGQQSNYNGSLCTRTQASDQRRLEQFNRDLVSFQQLEPLSAVGNPRPGRPRADSGTDGQEEVQGRGRLRPAASLLHHCRQSA